MALSIKPILLAALLAAACLPAARAQEKEVRAIPNIPPCIDLVLLGHLRSRGRPGLANEDAWWPTEIYHYSLDVDRTIAGRPGKRRLRLSRSGHAFGRFDEARSVVFLQRTDWGFHFADLEVAVPDRRGRLFLPLLHPPNASSRSANWLRDGFEALARPVDYWRGDMEEVGHDQASLAFFSEHWQGGFIQHRQGRLVVARGIYLEDIPAAIALGGSDGCWRLDRLVNPPPSR